MLYKIIYVKVYILYKCVILTTIKLLLSMPEFMLQMNFLYARVWANKTTFNLYIAFVQCGNTNASATCPICRVPIGNVKDTGMHNAASGNTKWVG